MYKNIVLFFILFIFNTCFSQIKNKSFPKDFLGIYRGELSYETPNGIVQIPMEFHLKKTDSLNQFDYWLVYNNQPRKYILITKDMKNGLFEIDENNGIILPARFYEDTLFSWFEVGTSKVSSRVLFDNDVVYFEILFSNTKSKTSTGGISDSIPNVFGYPISAIQRAKLKKDD